MKTIRISINLFLLSLLVVSCNDDFLDRKPLDKLTPQSYFTSEENAIIAVNGIYNAVRALNAAREYYIDYDCMTDNMYNYSRYQNTQEFGQGSHSASSYYAKAKWAKDYVGIGRANLVLAYLDKCYEKTVSTSTIKERLRGEAYFFRAFFYADLIDFYGDVPIFLDPVTIESSGPRVSKEIILNQIINDLDSAIVRLPVEYDATNIGRATKGAALAAKGKALLFNKRYAEAAVALKEVMNLKKGTGIARYAIYPLYRELFLPQYENNSEVIFDIQYMKGKFSEGLSNSMYTFVVQWSSFCPLVQLAEAYYTKSGLSINADPSFNPAKPFLNRDPRLEFNIMVPRSLTGRLASNGTPAVFIPSSGNPSGMKIRKFNDYTETEVQNSEHNVILMRYADVLLMYAEAAVMSGSYDDAEVRACIDAVRQRPSVMMPKVETVEGKNLSPDQYMEIIMHERRVEFAFEGTRISDIRRWRIGEQVMTDAIGYDVNEAKKNPPVYVKARIDVRTFNPNRDYLWPIPQDEIDANEFINPEDQNPGY